MLKIKFLFEKLILLLCIISYGSFSYVYGICHDNFYLIFKTIFLIIVTFMIITFGNEENKK